MLFKKYSSIENHYSTKFLNKMLNNNPSAQQEEWIAQEKIDGANIQLIFTPNEKMKVGKRTSILEETDSFFDIWNTLKKYEHDLLKFQEFCDQKHECIRVYGELYGVGINGRINYGPEKYITFFDLETEIGLMTQVEFILFMNNLNLSHLTPRCFYIGSLAECLGLNVEITEPRIIEGVVIKPYRSNFYFAGTERFILKKKSEVFNDKEKTGGEPKGPKVEDEMSTLNMEFRKYITKNRIIDVFAKHGQIQSQTEIGKYITLVLEDAKIDFLKDVTIPENLDKKQEKSLYNVGSLVVNLLKEYL